MPGRYENTPAARRVDAALRTSPMSARESAEAIGIRPNLLSMVRTGATALPPRRCARFAAVLGIDPAELASACVESYLDNRCWEAVAFSAGLRAA
jgi:DNA-binding transcriptional regulator YdaS (Cro superfamily)